MNKIKEASSLALLNGLALFGIWRMFYHITSIPEHAQNEIELIEQIRPFGFAILLGTIPLLSILGWLKIKDIISQKTANLALLTSIILGLISGYLIDNTITKKITSLGYVECPSLKKNVGASSFYIYSLTGDCNLSESEIKNKEIAELYL